MELLSGGGCSVAGEFHVATMVVVVAVVPDLRNTPSRGCSSGSSTDYPQTRREGTRVHTDSRVEYPCEYVGLRAPALPGRSEIQEDEDRCSSVVATTSTCRRRCDSQSVNVRFLIARAGGGATGNARVTGVGEDAGRCGGEMIVLSYYGGLY